LAALAKLRLHTETTVTDLENSATRLGNLLWKFKSDVCSIYATKDLPSEEAARGRRKAAKVLKAGGEAKKTAEEVDSSGKKKKKTNLRTFTMETYKLHGLPDYPAAIRAFGVTGNTSTKNVGHLLFIKNVFLFIYRVGSSV
jgi:hypothetical protein